MKKQILLLVIIFLSLCNAFAQSLEISDEFQGIEVDGVVLKNGPGTPDTVLINNSLEWQILRRNEFGRWENWTPNYWDSIKISNVIHDSIVANQSVSNGSLMWGREVITSTSISVTYPSAMSSTDYLYDVKCEYIDTVAGKVGKLPNPAWGFEFSETGFTGNVKYAKGTITWSVMRSENIESIEFVETDPVVTGQISSIPENYLIKKGSYGFESSLIIEGASEYIIPKQIITKNSVLIENGGSSDLQMGLQISAVYGEEKAEITGITNKPYTYPYKYIEFNADTTILESAQIELPNITNKLSADVIVSDAGVVHKRSIDEFKHDLAIRDTILYYLTSVPDTSTVGISNFQLKPAGVVPDSAKAAGSVGQMVITPMYWYVCTRENYWSVFTAGGFPNKN